MSAAIRAVTRPPIATKRLYVDDRGRVVYSLPPLEDTSSRPLVAQVAGFSLHAATVCEAWQRSRLERLCRYVTRPPIATKRLYVDDRGRVVYQYKHPFRDGSRV